MSKELEQLNADSQEMNADSQEMNELEEKTVNEINYIPVACLICNKSNLNFEKHECEVRKDNPNLVISNTQFTN